MIYTDTINNFDDLYNKAWSGAISRLDEIADNNLENDFMEYLEQMFDYTPTLTDINDFIWFECDEWIEEHTKRKVEDLTNDEVIQLRNEICLNSIYTSDYENSLHVDPDDTQYFFDGYVEFLYELAKENNDTNDDFEHIAETYDTHDNLLDWFIAQ